MKPGTCLGKSLVGEGGVYFDALHRSIGLAGSRPGRARWRLGAAGWLLAVLQRCLCVAGYSLGALQRTLRVAGAVLGVAGSDLGSVTMGSRRHRELSRWRYKGISESPGTVSVSPDGLPAWRGRGWERRELLAWQTGSRFANSETL